MNIQDINTTPPSRWMRRLKAGHAVWLVKEQAWASVAAPWIPPEPGYRTGYISIQRIRDNHLQPAEQWHIGIDGHGLNGSRLMFPAEGHLEDTEVPLSDLHAIYERLNKLEQRVLDLSMALAMSRYV